MNDSRTQHRSPLSRLPLRTALARVVAISVVAVLITLGALSIQMATGNDPALGPKLAAASGAGTTAATSSADDDSPLSFGDDEEEDGAMPAVGALVGNAPPVQQAPAPTTVQTATS